MLVLCQALFRTKRLQSPPVQPCTSVLKLI
uniref:Uncharacterized protein n=1 Tax=Lepeophtheirus salmonis TaxID=72036 RepID=A0A0K2TWR9_LEPSM